MNIIANVKKKVNIGQSVYDWLSYPMKVKEERNKIYEKYNKRTD